MAEHSMLLEELHRGAFLHCTEDNFMHCRSHGLARCNGAFAVLALPFYSTTSVKTKRPQVYKVAVNALQAILSLFWSAEQGTIANAATQPDLECVMLHTNVTRHQARGTHHSSESSDAHAGNGRRLFVPVENRSSRTLLSIIQTDVRPGATVITDELHADWCLSREAYTHLQVNHSVNFVDSATGAHTQSVESLWAQAKRGNKRRCGTRRTELPSYLCEFKWRKRLAVSDDAFDAILADILRLHSPRSGASPMSIPLPQ
ncbi:hypothetical protein M514_13524 [Trichuris suis]|uniref:ISXO2-like transposase domain-containing protein n=1 Tax=Trichuris suis TaxID=68888 RepID=A0A085N557_9BILA|nr:hypothetical protein M513_13524 [Trichuris suis]KFD64603.1 hypothetical protein M514_13524 [Trichuris suis]